MKSTLAPIRGKWRSEIPLAFGLITAVCIHALIGHGRPSNQWLEYSILVWELTAVLGCAFRAMHHADVLADRLGEPLGTMLLTVSAIVIEVALIVGQVMGANADPTVARDTMYSVLMLILNGLVGISILVAGIRRKEQVFSMRASSAYLSLIIGIAVVGLILPRLTTSAPGGFMGPYMQTFAGFGSLLIYLAFLMMQASSHKEMFAAEHEPTAAAGGVSPRAPSSSVIWRSAILLIAGLLCVVGLAESLGTRTAALVATHGLPHQAGGAFVAILILAPEGLAAIMAAGRSNLQRTINILLGSALATLGLTIPAVLIMGQFLGIPIELGLEPVDIALLAATLLLCSLTLTQGRINIMQALVHLLFFATWVVLLFD